MNRNRSTVQRQPGAGHQVETGPRAGGTSSPLRLAEVDVEALADRVYARLLETLRLEQDRGAWEG